MKVVLLPICGCKKNLHDRSAETFFGMVDRSTATSEAEFLTSTENQNDQTITIKCVDHIAVSRTDVIQVKSDVQKVI